MRIREVWNTVAEKVVDTTDMKSHRPGTLFAMLVVLAMTASMLVGANIASADQVQVQSYQRTSQTAACAAQPGETPWQAAWGPDSSWTPSYEMWANNGTGGWVCTRSITWARSESSTRSYALGDTGPGGGLVFLISGGMTYEMAPKAWSGALTPDSAQAWCSNTSTTIAGTFGTAIGTGSANTDLMVASTGCSTGAAVSTRAYRGGGLTDWFLPSKDELNAMCNYARNPTAPAAPSESCGGSLIPPQDTEFGFASDLYWSSFQLSDTLARFQSFDYGNPSLEPKANLLRVRPIRAF